MSTLDSSEGLRARQPSLDGLRGLAACLVFIAHSGSLGFIPSVFGDHYGQQAVGLFFMLSGFLMADIYLAQAFSWRHVLRYANHRIRRVVPLFVLVVLLCWAAVDNRAGVWVYPIIGADILRKHLLFQDGVGVLWTIPVEMQFYVLFVGLWWAHSQRSLRLGLAVVAVAAALLLIAKVLWASPGLPLASWIHFFLLGVVLSAYGAGLVERLRGLDGVAFSVTALLMIALLTALSSTPLRQAIGLPLHPIWRDPVGVLLPTTVFLLALARVRLSACLDTRILRWLGKTSYGIYLFHYPVLKLLAQVPASQTPAGGLVLLAVGFLCTTALAFLSYRCFERPAIQLFASFEPVLAIDAKPRAIVASRGGS